MATEYKLPFTAKEIEEKLSKVGQPVSYNELNDKPFGEEVVSLGDTISWDLTLTDTKIDVGGGIYYQHVSNATPAMEDLVGGTFLHDPLGVLTITDNMLFAFNSDIYAIAQGGDPLIAVSAVENCTITFDGMNIFIPKKGIYFLYASDETGVYAVTELKKEGYNFTETKLTPIDPKFLPEGGFGYGNKTSLGDTLTWDGTIGDRHTITTTLDMGSDFGGETEFSFCHVSDNTPSKELLPQGCITLDNFSYDILDLTIVEETDICVFFYYVIPVLFVCYKDSIFEGQHIKKGIYFVSPADSSDDFSFSLKIPNYNFIEGEIHKIDPKFLPEGIGYGDHRVILPETTFEGFGDLGPNIAFYFTQTLDLEVDETYKVTWNGTEYTCIGQDMTKFTNGEINGVLLGNASIDGSTGTADTGEPFCIAYAAGLVDDASVSGVCVYIDGSENPTVSITSGKVHKIDPKYLPDGIGYEEQTTATSNTLIYDGQPTDTVVVLEGTRFYHISGSTPEASDLIGGVFGAGGQTMQIEESMINDIDECIFGVANFMLVCSEDNYTLDGVTFTKKGIYAISAMGEIPYPVSLTCQNYQFTQTINKIHHIDNKYIKEGLFERSIPNQILLDTVITVTEISSSDTNMIDDESVLSVFDSLRSDRVYSIVWNGVEYNCSKLQSGGTSIMGNMSFVGSNSFANTGEPFLYLTFDSSVIVTRDTGDISIKIIGDAIQYTELPRETLVNATPLVLSEGDFANPSNVISQIDAAWHALQNHRRVYCMYNGKLVEMIAMYYHSWDMPSASTFSLRSLDHSVIYDKDNSIYGNYTVRTASIQQKTITSSTATGRIGDICYDSDYVYVCVAENTWKRFALETW